MSLVAFAIRASLVKMLRGATFAGANVFDSPLDPVGQAAAVASPLIHVYTESEAIKTSGDRALLEGDRTLSVTMQMFLPVDEKVPVGTANLNISARRGGGQAIFDVMFRQIEAAVTLTPNPWRDFFDIFVTGYVSVTSRPYVIQTDKGVRLAAREIEFICLTLNSPPFGEAVPEVWQDFLDAMTADADLSPLVPIIRSAITGDVTLSQSDIDASLLGLSYYEAEAVSIAPTVKGSEIAPQEITVDRDGDDPLIIGQDAS